MSRSRNIGAERHLQHVVRQTGPGGARALQQKRTQVAKNAPHTRREAQHICSHRPKRLLARCTAAPHRRAMHSAARRVLQHRFHHRQEGRSAGLQRRAASTGVRHVSRTLRNEECQAFARPRGAIGVPDVTARHTRITGTTRAAHACDRAACDPSRVGGGFTVCAILKVK